MRPLKGRAAQSCAISPRFVLIGSPPVGYSAVEHANTYRLSSSKSRNENLDKKMKQKYVLRRVFPGQPPLYTVGPEGRNKLLSVG